MFKIKFIFCACLLLFSCIQGEVTSPQNDEVFFSLKNYFEEEAQRLSSHSVLIKKQVKRNASSETKDILIQNWEKEFGLFIESDINKLGWKDSYETIHKKDTLIYQSKEPDLRTQRIILGKKEGEITSVQIINKVENRLYQSIENLSYYPDSIYTIEKQQNVLILGTNRYFISGILPPN